MTNKEVKELILWMTEYGEGTLEERFVRQKGSDNFILRDPDLSARMVKKKVFYTAEDIIKQFKTEVLHLQLNKQDNDI